MALVYRDTPVTFLFLTDDTAERYDFSVQTLGKPGSSNSKTQTSDHFLVWCSYH